MKLVKSCLIFLSLFTVVSCASNDAAQKSNSTVSAPSTVKESTAEKAKIVEEETPVSKKNQDITLEIKSNLAETTTGSAFSKAFSVIATDSDKNPLSDISIRFEYPETKVNDKVTYTTIDVTTNSSGVASFTPSPVNFSISDTIYAYPTPSNNRDRTVKAAKEKSVKCDFKVKSGFYKKHICLYTYEYDERNKPKNNFYNIIGEVRNLGGTNIGNGPFNDAKLINESPEKIIAYLKDLGYFPIDKYEYLIVGTVKFTKPTAKVDNMYSCSMIADIYAVDLKTNEIVYKTTTEATGTGKNWGQDQADCKNKIGKKIVNDLLYTLK